MDELVVRARGGDRDAFSELVARSIGRLTAVARMILRDEYAAQDAVQEAFIEAWRSLPGLREPEKFDAWLRRLLVRACFRGSQRRKRVGTIEIRLTPADRPATEGAEHRLDLHDQLERGLARIPAHQRAVVVLVYYLDLPLADAAHAIGIPVGTAKSRLNRATQALRAVIEADDREPSRAGGADRVINDRFGAQLRQHFLDTANERPADGQLEAAIERVATTSQHRPLVARLTWFPRRTTLFLSPMQRYALLVLALVLALLGLGILAAGGARARTVFEGTWTSTDPGDGSVQSLVVGAGTMPSVRYVDENASGEACRLDPVKVFTAEGEGIVGGPRLRVTYPHGGGCGLTDMDVRPGSYTYDPATDSLVEDHVTTVDGREITVTWNRAVAHVVPTRAPVTNLPPPATLAPTPDSSPNRTSADCSRLLGGSTYARGAGPVVLTATIPLEPATPWNGRQDGFILTDSCTRVPTISINGQIVHAGPVNSCLGNAGVVTTFSEAVARLAADTASGVSAPISLRIDGRDAVRFDVRDLSSCGFGLESGVIIGPGESGSIYVVDMDGIVLSVELNAGAGATQKQLDEARTIVASLRLGAAASPSGSAG